MAVPEVNTHNILEALKYIDENGVPFHNQSTQYDLVTEDGKKYPPVFVFAVAQHLANGTDISTSYRSDQVIANLKKLGFLIEAKLEKYVLTITADTMDSTDERFSTEHLKGDEYKVLDAYFQSAAGEIIKRNYAKGERRQTNQTMPRLAFQLYEKQIAALSPEEKEAFPICRYKADGKTICGIFSSVEAFRHYMKTIQYLTYRYEDGRQFVIYCWNIFSTLQFVQECLRRFGNPGDQFVLTYRDKDEKETDPENGDTDSEWFPSLSEYDPGLTVEDWRMLLKDPSVFDSESLKTVMAFYNIGGQSSLSELASQNEGSKNYYKSVCERLAQRVIDKTNCPPVPEEINQGAKTWPVVFVGRHARSSEMGSYIWRLRDELRQALEENESREYRNPFSRILIESKNIIFRGAPGTGKSYLAKEIAADIISKGYYDDYTQLTDEQKQQVEFVQFHPSYDYSDFVEGLRPQINPDGTMGFSLQDGVFKRFVARARKNYENSQKSQEAIAKELSAQEALAGFLFDTEFEADVFKTINGNEFTITDTDDQHIYIYIPNNPIVKKLCLNKAEILQMLESDVEFTKIKDITAFFRKEHHKQEYSYYFSIYQAIRARKYAAKTTAKAEKLKPFIFIIDEINRGEISKIFGELFFAIDPGYRGKAGEVSTQYANLHTNPDEKFYIPENVYIIGTMNDIDRSVDSFDFAMRRRFRFIEIKANARQEMLALLNNEDLEQEAIRRMDALNDEIAKTDELNENYQIGAAYFLKLKTLSFDQLWTDYLQPLLQEYIQGMYDEPAIMKRFAKAYGYQQPDNGNDDEADQNQG